MDAGNQIVATGKHKGRTFVDLFENERSYALWHYRNRFHLSLRDALWTYIAARYGKHVPGGNVSGR